MSSRNGFHSGVFCKVKAELASCLCSGGAAAADEKRGVGMLGTLTEDRANVPCTTKHEGAIALTNLLQTDSSHHYYPIKWVSLCDIITSLLCTKGILFGKSHSQLFFSKIWVNPAQVSFMLFCISRSSFPPISIKRIFYHQIAEKGIDKEEVEDHRLIQFVVGSSTTRVRD